MKFELTLNHVCVSNIGMDQVCVTIEDVENPFPLEFDSTPGTKFGILVPKGMGVDFAKKMFKTDAVKEV